MTTINTKTEKNKRKILIIEDAKSWSQLLTYSLTNSLGETILTASSMKEAIELMNEHQFDAAIADLCLPDAPHGEVIEHTIKRKIPTWVLTGSFEESTKNAFLSKPIVDYVIKNGTFCLDYISESIKRYWDNKTRCVLVIDDTQSYQLMYKHILEAQNLTVFTASNGEEALSILEDQIEKISLVLTDYEMPTMNGIDFCRMARQKYHKDKLSIIAISSSTETVAANFLKSGANDFISKPFSREELVCRINQNIDTVYNIKKIKQLIDTDFLTGIFNRRHCFSVGEASWNKWTHRDKLATAVMLDIDFFKKINDVYGHDIGDMVIKTLATRLKDYAEAHHGFAYRFGGEEFALLLPITFDEAYSSLEILRQEIENLILQDDDQAIRFTISIGAVTDYADKQVLDHSLKAADINLYQAKTGGRNQIVAHEITA
jgi:diguanylate cyclase (GGDEF)-like protein